MSLIRPVIRMCTVAALRNKTWAENRVYDSDNTPLSQVLQDQAQPYITVYTDEDSRINIEGRGVYDSERNLSLVLEIGVAAAVTTEQDGTVIQIPATDEGLEFAVDVVESQAMAALIGDPKNPWAELLRRLILKIVRAPSQRGGSAERGTRWAARQLILICDVISDPPPGDGLEEGHPVKDFIVMARAEAPNNMTAAADLIEAILSEQDAPDWRKAQAWLVLTKLGIQSIGLAPVLEDEEYPTEVEEVMFSNLVYDLYADEIDFAPPVLGTPTMG